MTTSEKNIRVQKWVAICSVCLLVLKITAFYLTHSVSILTDALESIVNVIAGFVGLYSLYIAAKPRDTDHPYGHGKIEFLSAALEGSLILIAGTLIIYKAIQNLFNPYELHQLDIGILLITFSGIVNYIMGSYCERIGKKHNSLALIASGKHLQTDTYSTIGIIIGLVILYITNIQWIDSVVAILFSVIILYTGYKIIRTAIAGIMDETDMLLVEQVVKKVNEHRRIHWIDLHNLRIIKYGSVLHIDCHLTVPWYLNVREAHDEIEALAKPIRDSFGKSLEIFVHTDACLDFSCAICEKKECPVRKHSFVKRIEWTAENVVRDKRHKL
jgi:cation diffusion facilitator family transporter